MSSKKKFRSFRETTRQPGFSRLPMSRHVAREGGHEQPVDKKKRRSYYREYLRWLRPFFLSIIGVLVMSLITAATSVVPPYATMYVVDNLLNREGLLLPAFVEHFTGPAANLDKTAVLHVIGVSVLLLIIVQESLNLYRNWRVAKLNARVIYRIRQRLYDRMIRLPLHKLFNMKTGGITSRLSGDVDHLSGLVQMGVISPATAALQALFTIAMIVAICWQMALAAALILPPVIVINMLYIRRIRPIYRSMRHDRQDIDGRLVETFGGIRVVRAFRRERTEARNYAVEHHTVIRKQLLARFLEHVAMSGWGFLMPVSGLVVMWFGGVLVLKGMTTVGVLMAFQFYIFRLIMPISQIIQSYGQTQQGFAALERVFDLLKEPVDKPDRPAALRAPIDVESITFDRVTFGYDGGPAVLKDINLAVPGGSTVALVGPSGSGKTTLTNLVARFYDPDNGAIRLNGVDLRDIRLRSFRSLLAIVEQDTFLFDGTIADNIGYGRRGASRKEVEEAARRANAYDFVTAFPNGFETIIGERGVRLSGGQAQRISIARAILADPRILILDEATSNLDSESEQLIQESLKELLTNRTTFVIAHRLSTVVNADMIVVLEKGRVLEVGTHAELMAGDSRYRAMVARQQRGMIVMNGDAPPQPSGDWLA